MANVNTFRTCTTYLTCFDSTTMVHIATAAENKVRFFLEYYQEDRPDCIISVDDRLVQTAVISVKNN